MITPSFDKKSLTIIVLLFAIIVGLIIYFSLLRHDTQTEMISDCSKYPFINKTIDCALINTESLRTQNLDIEVRTIIDQEKAQNHITRASVFYRDLNTRQWFGVDDGADFYAASLLKLPLAMIYFKLAEIDEHILDQKLKIPAEQEDQNISQFFKPQQVFVNNTEYTIQELIFGMLRYSDNTPLFILNTYVNLSVRAEILHDLGIRFLTNDPYKPTQEINVRIYANILRQLYNASYLNLEYSNLLLEYLSQTTFSQGIVAGVPEDTLVSHKFGEAQIRDSNGEPLHILHDCGIVYKPEKPYILCIMTEGKNFDQLTNVIKRIAEASFKL